MTTDMRFADKTVADMVLMYQALEAKLQEAEKDWEKNYESAVKGRSDFRDLCRELRTQLAEAQAKITIFENAIQVLDLYADNGEPNYTEYQRKYIDMAFKIIRED